MSEIEADLTYAKEFWSISNAITGFSIVQSIIFYAALGPHQVALYDAVKRQPWFTVLGVVVGTSVYIMAIIFCYVAQKRLAGAAGLSPNLWRLLRIWRGTQLITIISLSSVRSLFW
jgi:hypothetical protein